MNLCSRAAFVWAAALVLPDSFVTSQPTTATSLITYSDGNIVVTTNKLFYYPVGVTDPVNVGRNFNSVNSVVCNQTGNDTNVATPVVATIGFAGYGINAVNTFAKPTGVFTNDVTLSNDNGFQILITVQQFGGAIHVSANNVTVGTVKIFGAFNMTFSCSASTPVQITFPSIVEFFPFKTLGNFGYGPAISIGRAFGPSDPLKLDPKKKCCPASCQTAQTPNCLTCAQVNMYCCGVKASACG